MQPTMTRPVDRSPRRALQRMARRAQPFLVLTYAGPMLVLAADGSTSESDLREGLRRRGHDKYIAWRLPADEVQRLYGQPFDLLSSTLSPNHPARVLDFDGARIFHNVSLARLGPPVSVERSF